MTNLERYDALVEGLTLDQRREVGSYLIGALSVAVSPEVWGAALESAAICFESVSRDQWPLYRPGSGHPWLEPSGVRTNGE